MPFIQAFRCGLSHFDERPTMTAVKAAVKRVLPRRLVEEIQKQMSMRVVKRYEGLSTLDAFSKIYRDGTWRTEGDETTDYSSGSGSHHPSRVDPYVIEVARFLTTLGHKPDAVDLGCGDFHVGSRIAEFCGRYIACDIVPSLIEFNRAKFHDLDVEFRTLDISTDELPNGDVVFVRQVLQHLTNQQIAHIISELSEKYKYLVLTEHLPATPGFVANLDKTVGPHTRLSVGSGVVLTQAPFDLVPLEQSELCRVKDGDGVILTTLYKLRASDTDSGE
jgi:SAM-dependent methyltransferase